MSKPNDKLPKWVEEAADAEAQRHQNVTGAFYARSSYRTFKEGLLAGAQLILDRLKATEKGDASAAPPLLSGFPEHAFEQGRDSVRREVLGDE